MIGLVSSFLVLQIISIQRQWVFLTEAQTTGIKLLLSTGSGLVTVCRRVFVILTACWQVAGDEGYLSGDPLHHHSGDGCYGAPFRVVEGALGVVQAGEGPDLLLGHRGLVGGLEQP